MTNAKLIEEAREWLAPPSRDLGKAEGLVRRLSDALETAELLGPVSIEYAVRWGEDDMTDRRSKGTREHAEAFLSPEHGDKLVFRRRVEAKSTEWEEVTE